MDRKPSGTTKFRRSLAMLAVLLALLMAVLALWDHRSHQKQSVADPAYARATVLEYLRALEARDLNAILKLVPADYDAEREAGERLQRFGGVHAHGASIRITADITPEVLSVTIRTLAPGEREVAWTENLFWSDGKWRLVLGGRRDTRPRSDLQRPER